MLYPICTQQGNYVMVNYKYRKFFAILINNLLYLHWETECLNTKFPLPTLLCVGYSVKLIHLLHLFVLLKNYLEYIINKIVSVVHIVMSSLKSFIFKFIFLFIILIDIFCTMLYPYSTTASLCLLSHTYV